MRSKEDTLSRATSASGFEQFEDLFDEIPAALAILRVPDLVLEAANEAWFTLLGRGDLPGNGMPEFGATAEEQRFSETLRRVLATGETQQVREVEVRPRLDPGKSAPGGRSYVDFTCRRALDNQGGILVVAVDATERVSARSLSQLEQVGLEAVFANVSAALAIVRGPEAIFEKTNASYEKLFIDRALIGKPLLEALPELRGQKFPELISAVLGTGEAYVEKEARALLRRTGDGALEERFFDQSYTRITDKAGQPYGVLIQALDVTERVTSREKLEAEAEKNARLLRYMPTPFFSVTAEWTLNYMNPAAEEVLGLRMADLAGRTLWEIFPGLEQTRFGQTYLRAMKEGGRIVAEDYYPPYDRWYEAWAYPLDRGLAVSFFDITRRKQDELRHQAEKKKLELIFHGSASPMVFFRGPDLVYEMVNEKYKELVPKRELLEKSLEVALPELAGTAFPQIIRRVFETGTPAVTYEELAPLKNPVTGEVEDRYFDSGVSRINDGAGKPYGVFVQATEVTDRVLARKRIEEALAARDTFLSVASHELRTPLTGMKLQAQMMKRALAKGDPSVLGLERVKKLVEQTDQGLTRMSRLVEDMLDISRIEAGKLSLEQEPTELEEFVRSVLKGFSEELTGAGIEVSIRAQSGRMPVSIDRFRMEQVLTNLITNAIKYAPSAPVSIELSSAGSVFRLVFDDSGPGIPQNNRERIFERFERLGSAKHVSGMGLGLYIVRQIVEAHGGRIYVAGKEGPGARFVVELPRAEPAEPQNAR
jgi:PAS domain S-box-containing protein